MKFSRSILMITILQIASALAENNQEQYEKFRQRLEEQAIEKQDSITDDKYVHVYKNTKASFTDCQGKALNPSVLIMPDVYPEEFKTKYVVFKFAIDRKSSPKDIEIVEGDDELAKLSKRGFRFNKEYVG